jgi:Fe-S-cluster-containing dehydrogenase component/CRP-like cAMP-binding protein
LEPERFPPEAFEIPVLRGIDARGREDLGAAGRLTRFAAGEVVYRSGDAASSFFVVMEGEIELSVVHRGDADAKRLRNVGVGELLGEEAAIGGRRTASARAAVASAVLEVPAAVFQRAAERAGAVVAARLLRSLRRAAALDLVRSSALGRELGEDELPLVVDAVRHQHVALGRTVFREDETAEQAWIVADGLVRLESERDGRLAVLGYVGKGDLFGDEELLLGEKRPCRAIASGPCHLLALPAEALRALEARDAGLLARVRRVGARAREGREQVARDAVLGTVHHALHDLYRMEAARELLVIDLESCVRCGHCAWACEELHGVARIVRRGDKVVTRVEGRGEGPRSLLLPSSCQHCENPTCLPSCPTGAIVRDGSGEVRVREALCTGCGACAKACPWDNIQIAARPLDMPRPDGGLFPDVAVKCDLCHGQGEPACVAACPVEAVVRLDPSEALPDVRALLGRGGRPTNAPFVPAPSGWPALLGAGLALVAMAWAGAGLHEAGRIAPGRGLGLAAGSLAAASFLGLLAYALPKRRPRWLTRLGLAKRAVKGAPQRSRVLPAFRAHLVLGLVATGLVLLHAPPPFALRATAGSALLLAFAASALVGALAAIAYRVLPPRLARIERGALLPEDFAGRRRELTDSLFAELRGRSEVLKRVAEKLLLPYATSPLGPLALLASGRRLKDEEARLRARIGALLAGPGAAQGGEGSASELLANPRLAGHEQLVRIAVELRALPAARLCTALLRVGLPLHIVTFCLALALLALHVGSVLWVR